MSVLVFSIFSQCRGELRQETELFCVVLERGEGKGREELNKQRQGC